MFSMDLVHIADLAGLDFIDSSGVAAPAGARHACTAYAARGPEPSLAGQPVAWTARSRLPPAE